MTTIPTPSNEGFREILAEYMRKHDITKVADFAEHANMKTSTMYDLLSKDRQAYPSVPTLIQLATTLKMPTHELLYLFAPQAPGAPDQKAAAKARLRAIGQHLPSTEAFLAQRKDDSRDSE